MEAEAKIEEKKKEEEKKKKKKKAIRREEGPADFLPELLGKKIAIKLHNGETIAGKLLETSRFWIKVEDTNGNVIQIHKAFMAVIYPLTR